MEVEKGQQCEISTSEKSCLLLLGSSVEAEIWVCEGLRVPTARQHAFARCSLAHRRFNLHQGTYFLEPFSTLFRTTSYLASRLVQFCVDNMETWRGWTDARFWCGCLLCFRGLLMDFSRVAEIFVDQTFFCVGDFCGFELRGVRHVKCVDDSTLLSSLCFLPHLSVIPVVGFPFRGNSVQ